ncbi:mycofactocin biosynthesis glycosyltransferase MftF [Nocardioides sp.]|uniref:mycofactocin biosynthesis glycosyltransferase MftF n=1 Tax=Nocardioides sp. TaxID=35761 RepID=UPI003D0F02FA
MSAPTDVRLPTGFAASLSRRVKICDDGRSLVGGSAGSVLYLAPEAAALVRSDTVVADAGTAGTLARLLLDRGFADPSWSDPPGPDASVTDVTLVVPIQDRAVALGQLLAALPTQLPVVVVDDGSRSPHAVAAVCAAYGARLVSHSENRGPAAARNTGLRLVETPYVAFCDSDVVPEPGWLAVLRRHLDDPAVAVVAPRILGPLESAGDTWLERYEQARSSLDLGAEPAAVRVGGAVSYLPSACLVARVASLGSGFDEAMRVGEDVDLVWRLLADGWRVRYEPGAAVRHEHLARLGPWLARKSFYGTSAAPLAARHESAVAPMVLAPWSLVLMVSLLAQRRWSLPVGLAAAGVASAGVSRKLQRSEHPMRAAAVLTLEGAVATCWQTSAALTRHYWPLAVVAATLSPRARRALVAAAVVEGLADYRRTRPGLGPVPYVVAHRLDDLAYGSGLWLGAWRQRSVRALMPGLRGFRRSG